MLDILKGKAAHPRVDTLKKLTGPLQCSLAYLTGDRDDPKPDRLSREEYALLDTEIRTSAIVLATGIYRERGSGLERTISPTIVYRNPSHPKQAVSLAIMDDDSLAGIGILEGDQLTFVADHFGDIDLPLSSGSIAIVRRDLGTEASEYSARQIEIAGGDVYLTTRPAVGEPKAIKIWSHEILDDEPGTLRNNYLTGPGNTLTIEGLAIRVTRILRDPF
ncbi:hypothetical protein GCM10007989_05180 [Devosia pacifica]|uniref:Uncharacterized protein n=1 Tax=Devosia pacifica TaxID=1335967 RepID=A0A918RWJ0_9HYPH|nr:hypothetical protein GCM10007989_05180 [Devosia pacifica]